MISPEIFGPQLWHLIHKAAQLYPNKPSAGHRAEMHNLLTGLPALVPCEKCRSETRRYLMTHLAPNVLDGDDRLFAFTVDFHNWVSSRLGKEQLSLAEARNIYPRYRHEGF